MVFSHETVAFHTEQYITISAHLLVQSTFLEIEKKVILLISISLEAEKFNSAINPFSIFNLVSRTTRTDDHTCTRAK